MIVLTRDFHVDHCIMSHKHITALPYQQNPCLLFAHFLSQSHPILLDSCHHGNSLGRFDIFSCNPKRVFEFDDTASNTKLFLTELQNALTTLPQISSELPFTVGLLGYSSYDFGLLHQKQYQAKDQAIQLPKAFYGLYDWSIVTDHQQRKSYLIQAEPDQEKMTWINSLLAKTSKATLAGKVQQFTPETNPEQYAQQFHAIKQDLIKGNSYQTNLTMRFKAQFNSDPWQAYIKLRQISPVPFACFMQHPKGHIISLSPERFIRVHDKQVLSQPIKGTIARDKEPAIDLQQQQILRQSSKDQAENVMIVDMVRHDLSQHCRPGSVKVPKLCDIQSFNNVHHLVSDVTGELRDDCDAITLLHDAAPGASITGAPKIATMKIINALEQFNRHIYCGNIAYFDARGHADSNIAIRTLVTNQDNIYAYAGGGIIMDSDCHAEYQEALVKIEHLTRALEEQDD